MNFLDAVYFDNTVRTWLVVAGIILATIVLKKLVSRYVAALLFSLVRRVWKTVDQTSFVNLVIAPLQLFLLVLITVFSLASLRFPTALQFEIYRVPATLIFERMAVTVVLIVFTWLVLRLIDFISLLLEAKAILTVDKSDDQLIVFFRDFLKVILVIVGILLLLKFSFGQNIGNLLTGLSIVGAALALAARESLENIIASFIIFFDKPFITGDMLKVHQISGTVERIGLRSTRIRTADRTLVTVPNKQMVDSIVDNFSMRTERRGELKIELPAETPVEVVKQTLAATRELFAKNDVPVTKHTVLLKEVTRTGLFIVAEYYTAAIPLDQFEQLKEDFNLQVKQLLETVAEKKPAIEQN